MAYSTLLIAPVVALIFCVLTYVWTTVRYKLALVDKSALKEPALIPFAIPWLGSAPGFLNKTPGSFFTRLLSWHGREAGACTLLLGGQKMHVLNSSIAINAMFKLKHTTANRDSFFQIITQYALGMSDEDFSKYHPLQHTDTMIANEFLLRQSYVNEVGVDFVRCHGNLLYRELQAVRQEEGQRRQVDLYAWLKYVQYNASVTALMGEHILEVYPNFADDFATFDRGILDLLFGFSRLLKPASFAARDRAVDGCTRWINAVDEATGGTILDARAPGPENAWEPHWGSRVTRARQTLWKEHGMSPRGRAAIELGFSFGLNSNAIPITGWMLMHILDPRQPDLLSRALAEIRPCATLSADGTVEQLDVQRLTSSPLLQSLFHETLRLYTDVLVTRDVLEDVRLPLHNKGEPTRELLLRKGSRVIAPSLMNHWDSKHFAHPAPANVFCAERFLVPTRGDSETKPGAAEGGGGAYTFSTSADGGRVFPWGGGRTMCPGRLFAKQEVLSAVALMLLMFDLVPVDEKAYRIPGLAPSAPGSGGMVPGGDVRVWLKPRTQVKS